MKGKAIAGGITLLLLSWFMAAVVWVYPPLPALTLFAGLLVLGAVAIASAETDSMPYGLQLTVNGVIFFGAVCGFLAWVIMVMAGALFGSLLNNK